MHKQDCEMDTYGPGCQCGRDITFGPCVAKKGEAYTKKAPCSWKAKKILHGLSVCKMHANQIRHWESKGWNIKELAKYYWERAVE